MHLILTAYKIVVHERDCNLQYLYEECILNKVEKIIGDQSNFFNSQHELHPSEDTDSQGVS